MSKMSQLNEEFWRGWHIGYQAAKDDNSAEPIKHGKWIADTYWHGYHCSLCGNQRSYIEVQVINYCPNCGAKMDERRTDVEIR